MVGKVIWIHIAQPQFLTILWHCTVIVKLLHYQLAQIQYYFPKINWLHHLHFYLTHLHTRQVLTEFPTILEVRAHCKLKLLILVCYQPHLLGIPNVLHFLIKNGVLHGLKKIFFKLVGYLCFQFCIQVNVSLDPRTLLKLDYSMHFLEYQSKFQCLIESSNFHHILFVVVKIWHQLIYLANLHHFYHIRWLVLYVMQLLWVTDVHLKHVAIFVFSEIA